MYGIYFINTILSDFQYGIRAILYFSLDISSSFFNKNSVFPLSKARFNFFFEASSMASTDQAFASITIDESHPFFLHHAKSPSAILMSQPLIGG